MREHPAVNRRVVGDAIADLRFSESNGGRLKCPNNRYSVAPLLTNPTRGAIFVVRKSYKTQKAQDIVVLCFFVVYIQEVQLITGEAVYKYNTYIGEN